MYPTELRLTLAISLGGSAAPSPKKNCSSCTMISWSWPSGVFSRGTRSRPTARWWVRINSTRVRSGRGWWPAAVRVEQAEAEPALRPRLRSWRTAAVSRLPRRSRCATRRPWPRAAPRLQGRTGAGQPCGPGLPTDSSAPPAGRDRSRRCAVAELTAGATRRESAGGW